MFDDLAIDTARLQVKPAPSVLGLFEPVSGIMLLNATDAEFEAMRSASDKHPLTNVFRHEMYHCFQTFCTGYQLRHVHLLAEALVTHFPGPGWRGPAIHLLRRWIALLFARRLPPLLGQLVYRNYILIPEVRRYRQLQQQAKKHNQPSLIGAHTPELYARLSELKNETLRSNKDGLSANDILECSAAVYTSLATRGTALNGSELLGELEELGGSYSRAFRLAYDACGERACRVHLPAAALALRYEHPENAYLVLVELLARCQGDELSEARRLAEALPLIESAGKRVLGTAVDVRGPLRRPNQVYDEQLGALKWHAWGVDEFDVLCDPGAVAAIPPGMLGFSILTSGGMRGRGDQRGSMVIAAIMLRGGPSVGSDLREVQDMLARAISQ